MILFRVDASLQTGYGRLARCLNLSLLLRGKNRLFFSGRGDDTAAKLLEARRLPFAPPGQFRPADEAGPQLLVYDCGEPDREDQDLIEFCRGRRIPIVQFKETPDEAEIGDLTIDLSLPPVKDRGGDACTGPAWAPLHPRFRHFQSVRRKHRRAARRLLLCLGGAPEYRRVRELLDMLCRHSFQVKVAADFMLKKAHRRILKRIYPSLRFVGRVECLARPLFEADIALVTPGSVALEAAAVGTPAVYLFHNARQQGAAAWLQEKGAGISAGPLVETTEEHLLSVLADLDQEKRARMCDAGKELVDGRGLFRVLDLLKNKGLFA